ncbi:MAG: hypothetical protein H7843_08220 [Nitrospirota bacterium]
MNKDKTNPGLWSIVDSTYNRQEFGDFKVGDRHRSALQVWSFKSIEVTHDKSKSIKEIDLGLYDITGQVYYYPNSEIIVLNCGVYAYAAEWPDVKNLRNGSFVTARLYIGFEDDYNYRLFQRDDPEFPDMMHTWEITDILVDAKTPLDRKIQLKELPVVHVSNDGSVYKRINKTDAYNDCDGSTTYIYICKKLD